MFLFNKSQTTNLSQYKFVIEKIRKERGNFADTNQLIKNYLLIRKNYKLSSFL